LEAGPRGAFAPGSDVDHHVAVPVFSAHTVTIEQRTKPPPRPVPHNRRADLPGCCDAQPGSLLGTRERKDHDKGAHDLHSLLVDGKILGAAAELLGPQQVVLGSQPLTTLASPCCQDPTPSWRAHAGAKAVRLLPPPVIWLKRSLHLSNLT
jgi:hypothetical protein